MNRAQKGWRTRRQNKKIEAKVENLARALPNDELVQAMDEFMKATEKSYTDVSEPVPELSGSDQPTPTAPPQEPTPTMLTVGIFQQGDMVRIAVTMLATAPGLQTVGLTMHEARAMHRSLGEYIFAAEKLP